MIFTIINNSIDNTRQSLALFNKDWDTYKKNWQDADGFWNKIGSVFSSNAITASDVEAIKAYNAQIESNVTSQTAFNRSMLDASPAAQNLVASYNGGKVSAEGMAVAQNAAKASTIGLTIAQYALNAAIGMGIGLVVSLVVNGVNKLIHANEEAIKSAKELREEYEEFKTTNAGNVKTLKELKEEFEELSEGVSQYGDNISLTTEQYERYNEIIQQIVGISPSLAEGYSTENGYIADKNGLLERAIELQEIEYRNELRKITNLENLKTSMSGYIAEYKDAFKDGFVAEGNFKGADDFRDSLYNLFNTVNRKNYDSQSMAKDIMESLGVEDVDAEMQKYFMNGYWQDGWFWDDYRDTIAENLDVVTNSLSFEEVELDEDVFNQNLETLESYAESYRDVKDSAEMANEAIQTDLGYIAEYADGYSDLTTEQKKFVSDFLKGFNISDIGSENALGIFTYDDDKMASVKNQIKEFVEELSKDEATKDALADLYAIPTDEQSVEEFVSQSRNALEIIKAYCEKNGIEIPITIINAEEEINALEDQKQRAVNYAIEKFNGYDPTTFFNENSINTKEEIDKWLEITQAVNSAVDAEKRYLQVFSEPKQPPTITETVDAINNKLKPALDSIAGIYTTLFDKENGYEWQIIDIDEFASISETLDSLKEEFGIEVPTEDFEKFVTVLNDSSTTAEQAQQAFNELATSMVNNSNVVELTDENFNVLKNSLEKLGITNAEEVLGEIRYAEERLIAEGIDLEHVNLDAAQSFIKEAGAADIASKYLQMHMLKKQLDNANPLNTYDSVQALEKECEALMVTGELLEKTAQLKTLYYAAERNLGNPETLMGQIDNVKSEINDLVNDPYTYGFEFEFDGNLNGDKSGSGSSSSSKDTKEIFDWIETLISRIQRNITNLGKVVSATYRNWSTRNNSLAQEMSEVNKEISAQMTAYNAYMAKANSIPLSESYKELVRSGAYNISEIADDNLKEQIKEYEEWYSKALNASDAIEDLRANLAELAMTKFNNVSEQYDEQISLITHNISMLEGFVSQAEAAGYMASEAYYKAMASKQQENISQLQGEYSSLMSTFNEAVNNGSIEKYSSDWYNMVGAINDVELELQDATTQLVEFNQTLQQLSWESFDRVQGYVSNIVTESEHLIDILDAYDLHTDKGIITDEGLSVQGLHAVNYNTYMEQALAYADEMAKIEEEMAKDPYDMELVDRRNELLGLQQEAIQNAMSEKEAIRDLVSDGYDKMLSSLDELINKRKEALQAEKDMYDYHNNISEKTSNIASLKKQLQAYSGDNSESAKATIQKLQVSLTDAEKDLQETEYEKYLSDQEQMLDSLYNQTEQWVNERLDNLDGLVSEAVDATNKNAETISTTIREVSSAYGYELSEQMESIWNSNNEVVSIYSDILYGVGQELLVSNTNITSAINGGTTNVINAISGLNTSMQSMLASLNGIATTNKELIAQVQTLSTNMQNGSYGGNHGASNNVSVSSGGSSNSSGGANTNSSGGSTPKKTIKGYEAYIGSELIGKYPTESAANAAINEEIKKRATSASSGASGSPSVQIYNGVKNALSNQKKTVPYYASGTTNAKKGLGIFGEAGDEILIGKDGSILLSSGATLYPFQGGEIVYNAKDTSEMLNNALAPLNINDFNKISPNMSGIVRNTGGDVNQDINVNFSLPNVTDANSLINELQHNKRFEKVIQSMTTDKMLGKNSLNKYKH